VFDTADFDWRPLHNPAANQVEQIDRRVLAEIGIDPAPQWPVPKAGCQAGSRACRIWLPSQSVNTLSCQPHWSTRAL
jgi:hypothetical protein